MSDGLESKPRFAHRAAGYAIQGSVFEVFRSLGHGFLEKVYEAALILELRQNGLRAQSQRLIQVRYKGHVVGEYVPDILVDDSIIIEVKARPVLHPADEAQLLNYLTASGLRVGYLVNFHYPKASIRRFVR